MPGPKSYSVSDFKRNLQGIISLEVPNRLAHYIFCSFGWLVWSGLGGLGFCHFLGLVVLVCFIFLGLCLFPLVWFFWWGLFFFFPCVSAISIYQLCLLWFGHSVAHSFNQGFAYMGALLVQLSSSAVVFWFVPTAANLIGQGAPLLCFLLVLP